MGLFCGYNLEMKKIFLYTFRTNPTIDTLRSVCGDITVLGSLRKEIGLLCDRLLLEKPEYVLGLASSKRRSVIEGVAVNDIHGNLINKGGRGEMLLYVPSSTPFVLSKRVTRTFCNYSMYRVAEFIERNNLKTKLMFVHLNQKDESKLKHFLNDGLDFVSKDFD
jgi:hypothetical protein